MKVTFLGTSGAFPTAERNATAHVVWVQGETLLLDCGEGAQRQLRRSDHRFSVDRIFISHLHLDHILGLPGYVWTLDLLNRSEPLRVYIPAGTRAYVEGLIGPLERLSYPLLLEELDHGAVVEAEGYRVTAARVDHAGSCLGFRVDEHQRPGKVSVERARQLGLEPGPLLGQLVRGEPVLVGDRWISPHEVVGPHRPGRSVVYSGDTRPCEAMIELARGASLLIHETMFSHEFAHEAEARGHSTTVEAAQIAQAAGVALLAMTHISQRHQHPEALAHLELEAQMVFRESFLPADLDGVEIPLRD